MRKLLLFLGLVMLGMNTQAKEYKYITRGQARCEV